MNTLRTIVSTLALTTALNSAQAESLALHVWADMAEFMPNHTSVYIDVANLNRRGNLLSLWIQADNGVILHYSVNCQTLQNVWVRGEKNGTAIMWPHSGKLDDAPPLTSPTGVAMKGACIATKGNTAAQKRKTIPYHAPQIIQQQPGIPYHAPRQVSSDM